MPMWFGHSLDDLIACHQSDFDFYQLDGLVLTLEQQLIRVTCFSQDSISLTVERGQCIGVPDSNAVKYHINSIEIHWFQINNPLNE